MAINNKWSVIGAAAMIVAVFVLDALLKFFATNQPWPTTTEGWAQIVVPAVCAGLAAVLVPHYSTAERATGHRVIDSKKDAPVIDTNDSRIVTNG